MWDLVYFNMKKLHQSFDRAQSMPAQASLQHLATYGEELQYYIEKITGNIPQSLFPTTPTKTNTHTPNLDFETYKEQLHER